MYDATVYLYGTHFLYTMSIIYFCDDSLMDNLN